MVTMQITFTDHKNDDDDSVTILLTAYDVDSVVVPCDVDICGIVEIMRSFIREHKTVDAAVIHKLVCHILSTDRFPLISEDLAKIVESRIHCKDIKKRIDTELVKGKKSVQHQMYYTEA
jgi:hypothetical protein